MHEFDRLLTLFAVCDGPPGKDLSVEEDVAMAPQDGE